MPTKNELKILQALPLEQKILRTQQRIREWVRYYGADSVCVAFSGGKDSTVLLHIVRSLYPNVKAVFSDTGLEYPSIREFVKTIPNVDWVKPKMNFRDIVTEYGYPLFGKEIAEAIRFARKNYGITATPPRNRAQQQKRRELTFGANELSQTQTNGKFLDGQQDGNRSIYNKSKYLLACQELPFQIGEQCCNRMKKQPMHEYERMNHCSSIVGTTAEESMLRTQGWLRTGCNAYNKGKSQPLSFWTEQDILKYIKAYDLPIASIYGEIVTADRDKCLYSETLIEDGKLKCSGCSRTGCMYCAFGAGNEHKRLGKSRFELLAEKYPRIYDYCMRGGQWVDNPYYDESLPVVDSTGWKNWNPKKIWVPSANGLGLRFVFNEVNQLYGKDYIKYE